MWLWGPEEEEQLKDTEKFLESSQEIWVALATVTVLSVGLAILILAAVVLKWI